MVKKQKSAAKTTSSPQRFIAFVQATLKQAGEREVSSRAAALAYFSIFSLGPLLFLILAVMGIVSSQSQLEQELIKQITQLAGEQAGQAIQGVIESQALTQGSWLASIIGSVGLVLGALGIFGQLQASLNAILQVKLADNAGLVPVIKNRLWSLGIIGLCAFLLILSLIANTITNVLIGKVLGSSALGILATIAETIISGGILSLLLVAIYRTLPDVKLPWKPLWITSLIVAILLAIGKNVLGIIIGGNATVSAYGVAGALIAILLWVFYVGQAIYYGATGLAVYTARHPEGLQPDKAGAVVALEQSEHPIGTYPILGIARTKFIQGLKRGWKNNSSNKK